MIGGRVKRPASQPPWRSIARTLQLSLVGLTVLLAIIGAIGIAALYDARQRYEDQLSAAAALEVAAVNVLAATVALEANLGRSRTPATARFVARAAAGLDRSAEQVLGLAADDAPSRRIAAALAPAQRSGRALAAHPMLAAGRTSAARNLRAVRPAVAQLATRQRERRRDARAAATDDSRMAVIAIGAGAGLALIAVLAFLTLLIRALRRPLDDLVDATRRMAAGDLAVRVKPTGPTELQALGKSFNTMGADLAVAGARVECQRRRLMTTIESLGDGLVICDGSDRISALNPRARELVPELRPGGSAHGLGSPLPQPAEALAGEVTVQHGGGTIAITAARLSGPDGGIVWTLRDITERARLEQAKSDFVATASHELRSPLTSIKGFIELLESTNSENLTERQLQFIRIALQSTDRLVDLVNDLLDVARIESGQFEIQARRTDLRATIEEVVALMQPRLADKNQQLFVQISDTRPIAFADPASVRQILTNLMTNAHQYTDEGGTITVRLDGDAGQAQIAVIDTGRGMSPEDTRRVFDRFYRGSADEHRNPGTGLGLAIVRSLVEMHGGSVAVDSQLGRGTTFTVALPAAPGAVATTGAVAGAAPTRAPVLAARRVLIVDDEPALAALIAQRLEALGIRAVQVHSGAEALARLRRERFDAMTLDVVMPVMNGFDVLAAVRGDARLRDLPIIFVSVSSTLPQLAGEWTVSKPIDRLCLTDVLAAAIQANRTRVLVVAPERLRAELEPALSALSVEHRWESTPLGAVRAGDEDLFEIALVHASMSTTRALLDGAALRGRRRGRSVILFCTDGDGPTSGGGLGMPVFPLAQAVTALRSALGERESADKR